MESKNDPVRETDLLCMTTISLLIFSCAGLCCYEGGGYCVIKMSEPILKFRTKKDLIDTLLVRSLLIPQSGKPNLLF
jgi:hypothetical protein